MDYVEMLFALEVRKMAFGRMVNDTQREIKGRNDVSSEDRDALFDSEFSALDYETYVKDVVSDIEKTLKNKKN